jgi:hypothetical protein
MFREISELTVIWPLFLNVITAAWIIIWRFCTCYPVEAEDLNMASARRISRSVRFCSRCKELTVWLCIHQVHQVRIHIYCSNGIHLQCSMTLQT